jgi:tripartite-type tricarboxylate transporter receptor subunit TctC
VLYKLPYDTEKDFEPVALITVIELALLAHPSVPANNVQELVKLAKAQPGKINYASTGIGSTHQLFIELLKQRGGFDMNHIPYKGSSQAIPDLVAGQVQVMYSGIPQSLQFLKSGKLKALAVGSQKRQPLLPDVQTVAEQGFPGYEANNYWGIWAPAGTPAAITQRLYNESVKQLDQPEVRDWFQKSGIAPSAARPEELAARVRADRARWTQVVQAAKIKVDQ